MDVHEALLSRRTAHSWTPSSLPDDVLQRALLAAHHAPCHKLTWPWRFVVLGDRARNALVELTIELKGGAALPEVQREAIRAKLLRPAAAIALARVLHEDPHRAREDYAAVACAAQNLMLSFHADGFASKWSTGAMTCAPRTYEITALDPAQVALEGILFVGRCATLPTVARPALPTVVSTVP